MRALAGRYERQIRSGIPNIPRRVSGYNLTALLPDGTCGNTIHRLVTNIQRFLDPAVEAWIGDTPYSDLIQAPGTRSTSAP